MLSSKRLFIGLCLAVWFVNAFTISHAVTLGLWGGLLASFISVPVWGLIGGFLSGLGLFFFRLLRVNPCSRLNVWQKADVGLALAIIVKPALGIPF